MSVETLSAKDYFRSLSILHYSLTVGPILMAGILCVAFNTDEEWKDTLTTLNFGYIAGALTIVCVLASAQWFGTRLKKVQEISDFKNKMGAYRSALIVRYAILEVPSLIAVLSYFFTHNPLPLIFIGFVVVLLIIYRPTKARAIADLELSFAEQNLINNPDAIIADVNISND